MMIINNQFIAILFLSSFIIGCSTNSTSDGSRKQEGSSIPSISYIKETFADHKISKMNELLLSNHSAERVYRVGPEDVLSINVFRVEDLSRDYQVNSSGNIQVAFIGSLKVKGLTTEEIAKLLTKKLNATVLRNPQIDVTVKEYRSREITVVGAVVKPQIYQVKHGVTIYEILSMSGGFSEDVGQHLYIKTKKRGTSVENTLVVNIKDMFGSTSKKAIQLQNKLNHFILQSGATVLVEKAGVVYIDGAVEKPGKYKLTGDTTVSQLIAESGGISNIGARGNVRIVRVKSENKVEVIKVDLDKIKSRQEKDIVLINSDIITVGESPFKVAFHGFFDYALRLMFLVR